jgi:hypothetical protein
MSIRTIASKEENIQRVKFALAGRVVIGSVNSIVGEEGSGKTTFVAYLAARWSRGVLKGDLYRHPCNVRVIGAEDNYNRKWLPSLVAGGARLSRVKLWEREDLQALDIREDVEELRDKCMKERVKVLIFDAVVDNLGSLTDSNHSRQVRRDLAPLRVLANELDLVILVCLHTNKRGSNFRQIAQGSTAFNQVSRSSLWLTRVPDGEENERVLFVGKSNYAQVGNPLEFSIVTAEIDTHSGPMDVATIHLNGKKSGIQMDEVIAHLNQKAEGDGGSVAKRERLDQLISDLLADGPRLSREVQEECMKDGHKYRTILRARDRLKVQVEYSKSSPPEVWWRLGEEEDEGGEE